MRQKYISCLKRSGAAVFTLKSSASEEEMNTHVRRCQGLLLPGGGDIDPALYGQEKEKGCGTINPIRDAVEPVLFKAFLQQEKPIFGICRGIQVMNVALGGTLLQDISDTQYFPHSDFKNRSVFTHPVLISSHTKLAEIFQFHEEKLIPVNSMHHQAADEPGQGLVVNAVSTDGFIEGLELKDYPFCIGVQWHPEHMAGHNRLQQELFHSFVDTARKLC